MARFDVYPMPGGGAGYVVDVQAELLAPLATRIVIPLLPFETTPRPLSELNPVVEINGQRFVLQTQALAGVPLRALKRPVGSLAARRDDITRALDVALVGF